MLKEFPCINTRIMYFGNAFSYFRDEEGVLRPNKRVTGMLAVLTLLFEIYLRKSSIVCLGRFHGDFF